MQMGETYRRTNITATLHWALWQCGKTQSSLQVRHMKTHLECAKKKHVKDPQTVRNKILWSDEPQFQTSCLKGTSSAHQLQSTIPKVKCAGSSLMLWGCFSAAGTEGLIRVEEKLNAPKYWDSLNENSVQSIQNLRRGRRFTFQQDNEPKHTARVAYRQLCECPWVAQREPELEPNEIFLEKPENVYLPHPTWQSLRGEEVRRRMADNCQMLMSKACRIKQKRLETVKVLQLNIYAKGYEYLCNVLISVLLY